MFDRSKFIEPNWSASIDLDAQRKLVPSGATVKGMQFQALLDECEKRGHPLKRRRYHAFANYPGEELLELLVDAAQAAWAGVPIREGLRRLGRVAYPTLKESAVGRVAFGMLGGDIHRLWPLVAKGYRISGSTGTAEVLGTSEREGFIRLTEIYSFVDAWHIGIFEGAAMVFGHEPTVRIHKRAPTSADLWISW